MSAITPFQMERAEMELVLQSGTFGKAPRLGKLFRYICERHFEGQGDRIKECSIAIEALGRPTDFDSRKDSIVRVEAHRLRRRLEEYYSGPGASDPIRIVIPSGQYRPQFLTNETAPALQSIGLDLPPHVPALGAILLDDTPQSGSRAPRGRSRWFPSLYWVACALPVLLGLGWLISLHSAAAKSRTTSIGNSSLPRDQSPAQGTSETNEVRLLCGYSGPPFQDVQGHLWMSDAFFSGGKASAIPADRFIEGQRDPHLIRSQRSGDFSYEIPLRPGSYELHLLFAETEYGRGNPAGGGEADRIFDVGVNGVQKLAYLDPLGEAGAPNRLDERVFKDITPEEDGKVHISFTSGGSPAFLNGIELLASEAGHVAPVRLVTQRCSLTDSDGKFWAADEYFVGGAAVARRTPVTGAKYTALFRGERYGNFNYRIPLAPGKYRLTMHFAEQWFGTAASSFGPIGGRSFTVYANRVPLLCDFQPGLAAGGANREVQKTFDHLQPNQQGILLLEFVPSRNYAEVNAIEVVESR